MDKFKKLDSESREGYIFRIYNNKIEYGLTNKQCADIINSEIGEKFQESYYRGIYKHYAIGYNECLENNSSNELLQELEEKREELEKEKIRLQDQKREYRTLLRTDARFEHLVEEMKKSISALNESYPLNNTYQSSFCQEDKTEAVLILSDFHFGIKEKNYWNEINVDILKKRVDKLKDYVVKYTKRHNVETLHIEILGDMINGIIHIGTRISNEEDVISQTMHCAEMLCRFVNDLAIEIPNVKIYTATGNHGRCSANIKESLDTENFEKMIPWYMEGRLENNVELMDNIYEDDIIIYEFLNETIFAVHGHNDKVGSAVNELSKMFKKFPTETHLAHYHSYYEKEDHDIATVVNGTASGVDKYAKKIRKTSRPMQTLLIYNEEGRECTYKIKLD